MSFTVLLVLMVSSLLIAGLGVPMWLGKVPPNSLYGFRTPLTVNQPDIWYPVNRVAGIDLMWSGIASALLPLLYFAAVMEPDVLVMFGLWLAPTFVGMLHSFYAASAIAAERLETPASEPEKEEPQKQRRPRRQPESE